MLDASGSMQGSVGGGRGWTPLGRSLNAARGDFAGTNPKTSSNFVYVVSDGIETCGGTQ
jgi:hypothetical protein